ncbi:uncharacterized protein BX664DRAFT_382444 [Halteromyces radiatus]|uniref:uncharacterized protein n=1 Tax=Halteromyces radiatus TaxID=101107 RepID=UPI00221EF1F4|nr:uncharacterized protein BX664DRAFT_382444 [Halteromyces radiatus]KAI8099985.1 hypothetical protein BX664DRAFT_382444 [Halteromyces radiatus]
MANSSSTTFLSSTQLNGIADKLSSVDDRQKYRQIINLSSNIQTKLNQLRLERMNANTFSNQIQSAQNDSFNLADSQKPLSNSTSLITSSPMEPDRQQMKDLSSINQEEHYATIALDNTSLKDRTSLCIPPVTSESIQQESIIEERRDSAVDVLLQQPSINTDINFQEKALPSFPDAKHDSILDYYDEQPINNNNSSNKKSKVTFADQLVAVNLYNDNLPPSPSSCDLSNNYYSNNDVDASFLLITPPASPRHIDYSNSFTNETSITTIYKEHPLPLPPIIHVQKKINGLLGFLTRTYQLNEIISSRTLISTLGLFNAMDSTTGHAKAVLKVTMTSTQIKPIDEQNNDDTLDNDMLSLFGFTFFASVKRSPNVKRPNREDPDCLVVSDHIVADALDYWIQHQTDQLPRLTSASHILRESVKVYVVYDKSLFLKDQLSNY